jgi:hypothetical protein
MLPKSVDALDELIRSATTAGEMAAHMEMFQKFMERGSRVAGIRTKHHPRHTIGWVTKDFLAWEKRPDKLKLLLRIKAGIIQAMTMDPATPIDITYWQTLENTSNPR